MKPTQLRFWPDPRPVVDRLGEAFFRDLPQTPGVYLMYGAADAVLYVGKARNLRHRLSSYRVANPDRLPRRLLRLLHRIERIDWETCEDETAALQREAELLLSLKPRFNRAGVWPKPRRFLAWRVCPDGLELAVTEHPKPGWHSVGPSGAMMTYIHRALVRLLWQQMQPERGLAGMPAGWFGGAHGPQVLIPPSSAMPADAAAEFLALLAAGDCEEVQRRLVPAGSVFEQLARDDVEGAQPPDLQLLRLGDGNDEDVPALVFREPQFPQPIGSTGESQAAFRHQATRTRGIDPTRAPDRSLCLA